jgi:peptidoglycan L-alanyl-D-glutamate endopeptidase CwlK
MPVFSKKSLEKLKTCDPRLQKLFTEVVKHFDCTVVVGIRGKEDQELAFKTGKSKLNWPNSKHNKTPSLAVDVVPFLNGGITWDDKECTYFAGVVKGIAAMLNINIRWGGDWDQDNDVKDNTFNDLVHFEIA